MYFYALLGHKNTWNVYTQLIGGQPFLFEDIPNFPGCDRNIDMAHADMRKRIDDGICNRLRRSDGRRFADPLCPNGMMRRWRGRFICLPIRRLHRGGYQVVLEVTSMDIAIFIERYLLVHRR